MISRVLVGSCNRDHFRPSASPWRSPGASAMMNLTPLRLRNATVRMRSISSASKGSTSNSLTRGGLAKATGFPGDVAALDRLAESGAGGPMNLVRGGGPEPARQHPGVKLLKVLRLNAVD